MDKTYKRLEGAEWLERLRRSRSQIPGSYRAMFATWWDGIITDPALMVLPMDDHMVHRGDGVFEAARVVDGAIFDLQAHLIRLRSSADKIGIQLPLDLGQIKTVCMETVRASGLQNCALRLFVGRGPGSFSPNPYDCPQSQLYVVATDFKPMDEKYYREGVRAMISSVPQKDPFYSQIKSCNYLPNVLMKREAVDHGVEFSLGCSEDGTLYEGATENLAIIDQDGYFDVPKFDYTLRGTTLMALIESLAVEPVSGLQAGVRYRDLKIEDIWMAREAFMIGTTLEVLPLVEVEGRKIGSGRPGQNSALLRQRLKREMTVNQSRRTLI